MSDPIYPDYEDEQAGEEALEPGWEPPVGQETLDPVEAPEGIRPYELSAEERGAEWWQPVLGCCWDSTAEDVASEPAVTWIDPTGTPQLLPAYDANGDGVPDTVMLDTNGDGVNDAWAIDTDASGTVDAMFLDADGDGYADAVTRDPGENGQWTEPETISPVQATPQPGAPSVIPAGQPGGPETAVGAESGPGVQAVPAAETPAGPNTITVGGTPLDIPGATPAGPNTIAVGGTPLDIPGATPAGPNTIAVGGYPTEIPASPNMYDVIAQLVSMRELAAAQGDAFSVAQIEGLIGHFTANPEASVWVR